MLVAVALLEPNVTSALSNENTKRHWWLDQFTQIIYRNILLPLFTALPRREDNCLRNMTWAKRTAIFDILRPALFNIKYIIKLFKHYLDILRIWHNKNLVCPEIILLHVSEFKSVISSFLSVMFFWPLSVTFRFSAK